MLEYATVTFKAAFVLRRNGREKLCLISKVWLSLNDLSLTVVSGARIHLVSFSFWL